MKFGNINSYRWSTLMLIKSESLNDSIRIMRKNDKPFYIKNDLAEFANEETFLSKEERDMDFLAIKNSFKQKELFEYA